MKIPKYIDTALKRRTLYAEKLNNAMCVVDEFLDNNKIECESYDTHTGYEIYCNPCECGQLLRWDIEGGKTMQLNDIVKLAAKVGAEAATAEAARKENQRQKELKDSRLYNTKLLLTNYREFKACSKEAVFKASQADELISVLDLMWDPNNRTDAVVESIKKSAIKTKIIMTHIDAMLSVYGEIVAVSDNDIDRRRYYIMRARYIDDEARSIQSLAKEYFIDERTVYFDLDIAIDKMSKLLFGIETIRND